MILEQYLAYLDVSLTINFFILILALLISYYGAYRTNFVNWFFNDVIMPQFTRINKRYVRFALYKDQHRSIGLEHYRHAFMFTFLPLVIILFKSFSITVLTFAHGEGYSEWDFLGFIVLVSPALMLFHGSNLSHLKTGLIIAIIFGGAVYYFNNHLDQSIIESIETHEYGSYLMEDGKLLISWPFALFAGLLLIFSFQLFGSYAGNYNFIKYHRIFQNTSRTTIFGKKVSFPKVLINKILNFYLWLLPFVMLYSLVSIFAGNYNEGGVLAEYVDKDDPLQEMIFLNGFTIFVFINVGLVVLPLTKGMFQYKIFKVLGNFQDVIEKEKSDENIIKGYMNYQNEFGDVSSFGDLIMFILIFDSILGFFVKFGDFFTLMFLTSHDVLLLSSILKVEAYVFIILSIVFFREEKKGTDFFDMIQESFRGDYIDLKFFRLGKVGGFKKKQYMKMKGDTPREEVVFNIQTLMSMYRYQLALKLAKKLRKRDKSDFEVSLLLLRCYDSLGMNVKFGKLMKKLLKKHGGGNHELHLSNGRYLFYLQRYNGALASFEECLRINPDSQDALFLMGRCHVELEDYSKAAYYFDRGYVLNPRNFDNLYYYGLVTLQNERYVESMNLLKQAIETDIHHLNVWELLGDNYLHLGKEKESSQCFALVQESEREHIFLTKARAYQIIGDNERFDEFLGKAQDDIIDHIFSALRMFRHTHLFQDIKERFLKPEGGIVPGGGDSAVSPDVRNVFTDESGIEIPYSSLSSSRSFLKLEDMLTTKVERKEKKRILKKYRLHKKVDSLRELGFGFVDVGDAEYLKGNTLAALFYYRIAEQIYLKEQEFKFSGFAGFEDIIYRRVGDALSHQGYYDAAVDAHLKSLVINGDQPVEYFKAGLNYYLASFEKKFPLQEASDIDVAIQNFTKAIAVAAKKLKNPYYRFIYVLSSYFKGKALEVIGGFEKANSYLVEVSGHLKTYNTLWLALAESYIKYEKEVWGTDEEGRYILKYTTDKGRYYDKAAEILKTVLALDPTNHEAREMMRKVGG